MYGPKGKGSFFGGKPTECRCAGENSATRSVAINITEITLVEHELRLNRFCTPCITVDLTIRVSYLGFMRTSGGVQDLRITSCMMPKSTFGRYGTDMRTTGIFVKDGSGRCSSSQLAARSIGTIWERDIMCWRNTNYIICLLSAQFVVPKSCIQAHVVGIQQPRRFPPWCRLEQDHNPLCAAVHAATGIVVLRSVVVLR